MTGFRTQDMHETQIGRYEVVRVLGKGAMGVVCEARDPRLARTVAIKTIRADQLTPTQVAAYEARFLTEARSVARLSHPNIVSVFDSGQAGELAYLVMEFVPGVNLKHCLNQGVKFTPWGAVKVVLDVLAALDHAHKQKILHRDVKPENILLDSAGWVKLTDFGIAKILDAEDDNGTQLSGHSIGTPRYMSPEQVRGQPLDERSDLFSAGVLLYELLTARLPFDGSNQFAIAAQILNEAPPLPSSVNPAVPMALDAVVVRAMAKHPAERFQTGADFADALASTVNSLGGADVTARVAGAQSLVAAESAGMLRWLLSRMLTGSGAGSEPDASQPQAASVSGGGTDPVPGSGAGVAFVRTGATSGRYPTSGDGTMLYQREVGDVTVLAGATAEAGLVNDVTATASPLVTLGGGPDAVANVTLPAGPVSPTSVTLPGTVTPSAHADVSAFTHTQADVPAALRAQSPTVAAAGSGGVQRWLLLGGGVLLVALAAWWFSRGSGQTPVAMPAAAGIADANQTLSDREVLVQPGSAPAAASSVSTPGTVMPTEAPKVAAPAEAAPIGTAASAAAGAPAAATVKKPIKPTESVPAGKAADSRSAGKPEEVTPPPQVPAAVPKPVSAGIAPAPPAEPCAGMGFFERESCLWKQCSTDTYRSHAACERFQTRKPAN